MQGYVKGSTNDRAGYNKVCTQNCFACRFGECMALESVTAPCSFFKTPADNHRAVMKCFYRLIEAERFDLLYKYRKVLFRFGIFDAEIRSAHEQQRALELYGIIDRNRG